MSTSDGTDRAMARVAKCDEAAAKWRKLAAAAPDGSMRQRIHLNLARTAEEDANVSYLRAINPRRPRLESFALPVRVVEDHR